MVPIPDVRLVILTTVIQLGFPRLPRLAPLFRADDTGRRQWASFVMRSLRIVLRIIFGVSPTDLGSFSMSSWVDLFPRLLLSDLPKLYMPTLLQLNELLFTYGPFSPECHPEPETRVPRRFRCSRRSSPEPVPSLEQPFHILIRCRLAGCHLAPAIEVSPTHRPPT